MAHAEGEIELAAGIPSSVPSKGDRDGAGAKQNPATVSRRLLSQCALFRGLPADECERLIGRARIRSFMPDESIFLMGSEADCMMAILTGRVQISVSSPDGNEVAMVALPVRLAKGLLRMTTPGQDLAAGYSSSHVHLTQRQLGKAIGATRESVNKHLGVWQRRGFIKVTTGLIVIADRSSLEILREQLQPKCTEPKRLMRETRSYSVALRFDVIFLSCAFAFVGAVLIRLF